MAASPAPDQFRRESHSGLTSYAASREMQRLWRAADDQDERMSLGSLFAGARREVSPDHEYGYWHLLPDVLLERVLAMLTVREKYYCSQVCQRWYEAFHWPRVWSTFTFHDGLFTKRKFNLYQGWEKILDNYRASEFLRKKAPCMRTLIIDPMKNFYNLYEFLNVAKFWHDQAGVLANVETLRFHFSCRQEQRSATELVFGTGGQILAMLKQVMGRLTGLKTLELRDLLLEGKEGLELLDEVCLSCCESLRTLELVNVTRTAHTLLHPGAFVNLTSLTISPQNLGEDLLELLGSSKVRDMYILQNKYTENARSLNYQCWKDCSKNNPRLRVHLICEGTTRQQMYWQQRAPVRTILYDSPYARLTTNATVQLCEFYKDSLRVLAFKRLPRYQMPKSFHDRIDGNLVMVARQCPHLHTLVVRERISTATVLLLAHTATNLDVFHVRRNCVILRSDWPPNPAWPASLHPWLRLNSGSYEAVEREVTQILGRPWRMMTDKQFKMMYLSLE